MEAKIPKAENFKKAVNCLSTFLDEGTFRADEQGLMLREMTPCQLAMLQLEIPKKTMERYAFKEKGECERNQFTLSLKDLKGMLDKCTKKGDSLTLDTLEPFKTYLILDGERRKEFLVPEITTEEDAKKAPSLDYNAKATFEPKALLDAFKEAEVISSFATLTLSCEGLKVETKGDKGDYATIFPKDSKSVYELNAQTERQKAMFNVSDWLIPLMKAIDDKATLYIKTNAPLKVETNFGELRVTFWLAPRIEEM